MLVRLDMHAILGKPLKTATNGKKKWYNICKVES